MADPENHTLRLHREFRKDFSDFHDNTDERFDELARLFAGESVLGRFAAADVDKRIRALEKNASAN
jgi:hypothetical protein